MNLKEKNPTLLIIDDTPYNLEVAAASLRKEGYRVLIAESGPEGLDLLQQNQVDLILLDVMMPVMDGFDTAEAIRSTEKNQDIPIIFLTAMSDVETTLKAFSKGAVDYIAKPFNFLELLSRIKTHLVLKFTRQELEESNRIKDRFLGLVAHDLKAPFNAIRGLSQLLSEELCEKESQDWDVGGLRNMALLIENSAENAVNFTESLLHWARSHTGRLVMNPQTWHLRPLVQEILQNLKQAIKAKSLDFSLQGGREDQVYADRDMVGTVLRNLLTNAIKFTPAQGKVGIAYQQDKDQLLVTVSDKGVGIKPQDLEKLFRLDLFHSTRGTENEEGTGLGLILCQEFVSKMGGQIKVSSQVGQGSEFTFSLPIPMSPEGKTT